jgi:hypothetical protein
MRSISVLHAVFAVFALVHSAKTFAQNDPAAQPHAPGTACEIAAADVARDVAVFNQNREFDGRPDFKPRTLVARTYGLNVVHDTRLFQPVTTSFRVFFQFGPNPRGSVAQASYDVLTTTRLDRDGHADCLILSVQPSSQM